jgi:hypothetical protein
MKSAVRSVVSALTTVALIMTLATTQCVACGDQVKVSSASPPCCNPDGHCNSAAGDPCLKTHAATPAVVEQTIHLAPVLAHINCDGVQLVLSRCPRAELPTTAQYSPPYLYLLHSSFLI